MEPDNIRLGGGTAGTILHPLVAFAMILAIVLMFVLQRRSIVVPFLLAIFLVPIGQVIVLGGIHLPVMRIVVLFGLIRLAWLKFSSGRLLAGGFGSTDAAFTIWAVSGALGFILVYMNQAAIINRLGGMCDIVGSYFILRALIQDERDVRRVIQLFAVIASVMAICMLYEQYARLNAFGLLGGHRLIPEVRDGIVRSEGVFQHEILAGVFGATLMPIFLWLWTSGKSRFLATAGLIASAVITVTSGSSTPLSAYGAGVLGLCFWFLRKQMRLVRWGLVLLLVALHLTMKAPVWALIGHVDFTGGSSSYHRYALVDNCIRHFGDWWLIGTKNYPDWGWDMWDLCNEYVAVALTGGLLAFVCFVAVISRSFGKLGTATKRLPDSRGKQWFLWCLGSALFAHVVAFLGVSYFDQTKVSYYALLAMISTMTYRFVQSSVRDSSRTESTQGNSTETRELAGVGTTAELGVQT